MMEYPQQTAERQLRRRLLFRLLRDFDFDSPQFRYERITKPVARPFFEPEADVFEFNFQSHGVP